MSAEYVAFDAETGGIGVENSLLTLYMAALDVKLNIVDELYLYVKPNAGKPYVIQPEALAINKIDLIEHDKKAITESEAGQKLREFLWKHSKNGKVKLVPIGHNVTFDEMFIWEHILGKKEYEKYVSYRKLDTAVVAQFLKLQGKVPTTVTGSLTSLIEFLGLKFDGPGAHDAKSDTLATVAVLKGQLAL